MGIGGNLKKSSRRAIVQKRLKTTGLDQVVLDLPYVPVWPGLSRFKHLSWCPVPVSKMFRNFTSVKFQNELQPDDALL